MATRRRVRVSKKKTLPVGSPAASVPPSGLSATLRTVAARRADDADRGRALDQRGEQVPARLHCVVERDALAGQQQRAVQLVLDERARAEPLRVGRASPRSRAVPRCVERDEPGDDREHEQRGDAGEDRAQPPLRALARGPALVEEGALGRVELGLVRRRPVQRRGQARAAVKLARVAAAGVPLARGGAQLVVQAPALGVLLEPAAQSRPFAQQRLVRDLDLALARPSPAGRRRARRAPRRRPSPPSSLEAHAPAHDRVALALARQPQQDPPRDLALLPGSSRS